MFSKQSEKGKESVIIKWKNAVNSFSQRAERMQKSFLRFTEKLCARLPDSVTGDSEFIRQRLYRIYGQQELQEKIFRIKSENTMLYIFSGLATMILLIIVLLSACFTAESNIEYKDGMPAAIVRPETGQETSYVRLRLIAGNGEDTIDKEVQITVKPKKDQSQGTEDMENIRAEETQESKTAYMEREVRRIVRSMSESTESDHMILPEGLEDGTPIIWKEANNGGFLILIPMAAAAFIIVYKSRYRRIKAGEIEAVESIRRLLPEFMNKLVLLMSAGLVLTEAFDRIVMQREASLQGHEEDSYFYLQMSELYRKVKTTNAPLSVAFREFAVRSGVKELIRVSNIINDNIGKGGELTDKLRNESEILWFSRKKETEEKGRLAESKMAFPMAVLLLALVTITVAPALMEM